MTVVERLHPSARRMAAWLRHAGSARIPDLERRYDLNQLQRFEAVLNRHGRSLRACASVFEFGCGEGRLTQYLFTVAPGASIWGCDVRPEAIAACRRRCPSGRFIVNQPAPPLPVADAQCDLIYSYSVFTHLSEPNHHAWLKELARILKPGGVMLHTVHSYEYLRRAALFSPESLKKYSLPEPVEEFIQSGRGYFYVVEDPSMPEYGHTIICKEYVLERWPQYSGLELVEYAEGAIEAYPEGCQDLVLMRKTA